mmetsp:Transcript_4770/g.11312  ORF Transcript_4770/g.11312 Transcript_4770/m.11312 type:complete len:265 (+) Transcript_4770:5395-6189(+)
MSFNFKSASISADTTSSTYLDKLRVETSRLISAGFMDQALPDLIFLTNAVHFLRSDLRDFLPAAKSLRNAMRLSFSRAFRFSLWPTMASMVVWTISVASRTLVSNSSNALRRASRAASNAFCSASIRFRSASASSASRFSSANRCFSSSEICGADSLFLFLLLLRRFRLFRPLLLFFFCPPSSLLLLALLFPPLPPLFPCPRPPFPRPPRFRFPLPLPLPRPPPPLFPPPPPPPPPDSPAMVTTRCNQGFPFESLALDLQSVQQ